MRIDLLDYHLPEERIALAPTPRREDARMLVLDPSGDLRDRTIRDLPSLLPPGALVVLNDTRVLRARLLGNKESTGGKVEVLLVRRIAGDSAGEERWCAIGKGLQPYRPGLRVRLGSSLIGELVIPPAAGSPVFEMLLSTADGSAVSDAIEREGAVPLPPYLRRPANEDDRERYQTVFARVPGAVAAPTAGLHLSDDALRAFVDRGIRAATLTLHVGLGTFQPVGVDDLDDHPMHAEVLEVSEGLVREVAAARARRAPVVAIGTTVVRALESAADPASPGYISPMSGETRLLIQPGYAFRVVDGLLTNFHLPRSTLLALVSAFAGRERVLSAYREAIERGYRFYSYGDAMLIPPPEPTARGPSPGEKR